MTEEIAELIWQSEYRRATGKARSVPWSEVSEGDKDRYRYVARDIADYLNQQVEEKS